MLAQPFYTPYDADGKPFRGLIPGWGRYDPYYLEEMFPSDGNNIQFNMMVRTVKSGSWINHPFAGWY
jgi:hypothetical protein